MNDERLESLLRAAGRTAEPCPPLSAGLADRVRLLQRRRTGYRQIGGAALGVLLAAIVTVPLLKGRGAPLSNPHPLPLSQRERGDVDAEALGAEIAQLEAEARGRQRALRKMREKDTARPGAAALAVEEEAIDPLTPVRIEWEKTGVLLIDQAEHVAAQANAGAAADEYRRVVTLFPGTEAATIARQRLNQSFNDQGVP
jgi:hypothetical protein